MLFLETPPADKHTTWEDVQGILTGVILVSLSIQFLRSADLITGQIAGLALITSYLGHISFGLVFFCLNLPFYIIAVRQMGWRFAIKSLCAVALLSVLSEIMPLFFSVQTLHPAAAALMCGLTAGVGMISLFRHGTTLAVPVSWRSGCKTRAQSRPVMFCSLWIFVYLCSPYAFLTGNALHGPCSGRWC